MKPSKPERRSDAGGHEPEAGKGGASVKLLGGRYKQISTLGFDGSGGGQGEVWLAHLMGPDGVTNTVVLKRAHKSDDPALSRATRATTLQEARLGFKLTHENICRVTDVFEDGSGIWIVYELIQGVTIEKLWKSRRLTVPQICLILIHVAQGLDFAHKLGVIHRDVTPDNLMASCTGHTKVIDFGIAKVIDFGLIAKILSLSTDTAPFMLKTKEGAVKGKPGYFSPDILRGFKDPLCDIFNIGLVAFELFTGQRAYPPTERFEEQVAQMLEANIPSLREAEPSLDPELADLVDQLLQKDRNKRIQTAWNVYERIATICQECLSPATVQTLAALVTELAGPTLRRTSAFKAMGTPAPAAAPLVPARPDRKLKESPPARAAVLSPPHAIPQPAVSPPRAIPQPWALVGPGTPPHAVQPSAARTLNGGVRIEALQTPPSVERAASSNKGDGIPQAVIGPENNETYKMSAGDFHRLEEKQGLSYSSAGALHVQPVADDNARVRGTDEEKVFVSFDDDAAPRPPEGKRSILRPPEKALARRRAIVMGTGVSLVVAAIASALYFFLTTFLTHTQAQPTSTQAQPPAVAENSPPPAEPAVVAQPPAPPVPAPAAPTASKKARHHKEVPAQPVLLLGTDATEASAPSKNDGIVNVSFQKFGAHHPACTVSIDGVKAGQAPGSFVVASAAHRVDVKCDNGQSLMRVVDVAAGRHQNIQVLDAPGSR